MTLSNIKSAIIFTDDNLQLLCGACNSMKGKESQAEFIVALKEAGLRKTLMNPTPRFVYDHNTCVAVTFDARRKERDEDLQPIHQPLLEL